MKRVAIYLVLVGASVAVAAPVRAGDCGCERCDFCGCHCQCEKTCKLVVGHKNVPKITYCAECEEICIPGPSRKCGVNCTCETNPCTGCCERNTSINWIPNPCGHIRCKAKLVKIETPQQVPTYKWTVVRVCGNCAKCGRLSQKGPIDESQLCADTAKEQVGAPELTPALEKSAVVQASATEAISSPSEKLEEKKLEPASPVMIVKSKLMSLLGK